MVGADLVGVRGDHVVRREEHFHLRPDAVVQVVVPAAQQYAVHLHVVTGVDRFNEVILQN